MESECFDGYAQNLVFMGSYCNCPVLAMDIIGGRAKEWLKSNKKLTTRYGCGNKILLCRLAVIKNSLQIENCSGGQLITYTCDL